MDNIGQTHSHTSLAAHGLAVGLSDGLMGNSEVGHLNIGAGRVVWQDIVKIDVSIKKRNFHKNDATLKACERAKSGNGRLHFLGLVSFTSPALLRGVPLLFVNTSLTQRNQYVLDLRRRGSLSHHPSLRPS